MCVPEHAQGQRTTLGIILLPLSPFVLSEMGSPLFNSPSRLTLLALEPQDPPVSTCMALGL